MKVPESVLVAVRDIDMARYGEGFLCLAVLAFFRKSPDSETPPM